MLSILKRDSFERITGVPAAADLRGPRRRVGDGHRGADDVVGVHGRAAGANHLQAGRAWRILPTDGAERCGDALEVLTT